MKKKWLVICTIAILCIIFFYVENNALVTTEFTIQSEKIPDDFENFKIVQLSDLHSKEFGKNQHVLVQKVKKVNPDVIVFTGDLVDAKKYNEETSVALMTELVQIAPTYFVTGNHEWWSGNFDSLESQLIKIGVQVLKNEATVITKGNDSIYLVGIDDPAGNVNTQEQNSTEEAIILALNGMEEAVFSILLAHRPELLSLYATYNFHLVFSGHAHGGQVRIPFIGGLMAPNQGFLPMYTSGKYILDNATMIVNRGLGNSIIPVRIFNRPEIVVVSLQSTNTTE